MYGYASYGMAFYSTYDILYNHNIFPNLTLFYFLKYRDYVKDNSLQSNQMQKNKKRNLQYFDILKNNIAIEEFYQHLVKEFSS